MHAPDPRGSRPVPTGRERAFRIEDLFFSTTDAKGVITSGNDVFTRVAGYELDELVGRPHNLIRHPDMPRGAFRLLWDYLDAGRPVAAYVDNLAADGGHYWVLAYVTPIEGGFLSVRMKPGTAYFAAVQGIYAELRAFEQEFDQDVARRKELILASRDRLLELVRGAGFADYDAFMQAALPAEVAHRQEQLAQSDPSTSTGTRHDDDVLVACSGASDVLADLAERVADWTSVTETLHAHGATMHELADDIELFSLNAQIAATRLGEHGRALLAVAGLLTRHSADMRPLIQEQARHMEDAARLLGGAGNVSFAAAVSRLQLEVLRSFVESSTDHDRADAVVLAVALESGVRDLVRHVDQLGELLAAIDAGSLELRRGMRRLRALEVNGRVESTRVDRAAELGAMFSEIGQHVAEASAALESVNVSAVTGIDDAHRVLASIHEMHARIDDRWARAERAA